MNRVITCINEWRILHLHVSIMFSTSISVVSIWAREKIEVCEYMSCDTALREKMSTYHVIVFCGHPHCQVWINLISQVFPNNLDWTPLVSQYWSSHGKRYCWRSLMTSSSCDQLTGPRWHSGFRVYDKQLRQFLIVQLNYRFLLSSWFDSVAMDTHPLNVQVDHATTSVEGTPSLYGTHCHSNWRWVRYMVLSQSTSS